MGFIARWSSVGLNFNLYCLNPAFVPPAQWQPGDFLRRARFQVLKYLNPAPMKGFDGCWNAQQRADSHVKAARPRTTDAEAGKKAVVWSYVKAAKLQVAAHRRCLTTNTFVLQANLP